MKLPLFWLDAFAGEIFRGNPAAVVPLEAWPPDALLQNIARENNLSETAFFVRTGPARFHLRWFTPAVEVDLCGHATLAGAWTLFHELGQTGDAVIFDSRSGPLPVAQRTDGRLELDFPATPVAAEEDAQVARAVTSALGQPPAWLGRSQFDRFAVLSDDRSVRALRPDLVQVAAAGGRGLVVTAQGDGTCDFVSRFFAPQAGVPEDPVTGSAHCALAPYWASRLGKNKFFARQVSPRGGEIWCEMDGTRVKIAGHCSLYLRGEISI